MSIKPTQPGQAADLLSAAWVSLCRWFSLYAFIQTVKPVMTQPVGRHQVYLQRPYLGYSLKWAHQLPVNSDLCLQPGGRFLSFQRPMMLLLPTRPNLWVVEALLYSDIMFIFCLSSRKCYTIFGTNETIKVS